MQLRVLGGVDARNRKDALREAIEIDLDGDRSTWRRPRGRLILRIIGLRRGTSSAASASARSASSGGGSTPDAAVLIALRQQRRRLALLQHCEIQTEVLRVVVGRHVEPL